MRLNGVTRYLLVLLSLMTATCDGPRQSVGIMFLLGEVLICRLQAAD